MTDDLGEEPDLREWVGSSQLLEQYWIKPMLKTEGGGPEQEESPDRPMLDTFTLALVIRGVDANDPTATQPQYQALLLHPDQAEQLGEDLMTWAARIRQRTDP